MTSEEFTKRMQEIATHGRGDHETDHGDADDLMVEYLRSQGLSDAMDAFEGMTKWYA